MTGPRTVAPDRPRRWPAVLTLAVTAPVVAELVGSSNTPTVLALQPVVALVLTWLYGPAALLVRELHVRGRIGWRGALLVGAAFAALNEGVVAGVWYQPEALSFSPERAGRAGGVNWTLVVDLVTFHTFISLCIPVVLAQLAFPAIAGRPWLGRRGVGVCAGLCGLLGLLSLLPEDGVPKPDAGMRLLTLLGAAVLVVLALRLRPEGIPPSRRPAPGLRRAALAGGALAVAFGLAFFLVPAVLPLAGVPVGVGVYVLTVVVVVRWAGTTGWTGMHALAMSAGALTPSALTSLPRVAVLQPLSTAAFVGYLWLVRRRQLRDRSGPAGAALQHEAS